MNKRVYVCKKCSPDFENGNIVYWCNKCKESTEHEHTREKYKGILGAPEPTEDKQAYLDKLLQEYYDLDCEDIIGDGKVKTRFKYTTVPKEDFGLTPEEILLLDDRQLNKMVSMKHLRPYRHLDKDGNEVPQKKFNEYKIRKMKQELKDELEQKRQLVRENM